MGVVAFEINPNSYYSSTFSSSYSANSFSPSSSSYAVPISSRPFFGNVLTTRVSSKFHSRKLISMPPLIASLNTASNTAGLIGDSLAPKDLQFKPSFDEYLKAMESRTSRRRKKRQQNDSTSTLPKEDMKGNDGFRAAKEKEKATTVMYEQGSSTSSDVTARGRRIRGFKDECDDTKESEIDVKGKQKHGAIVREGVRLKRQNHSGENSQGKTGSGRISYDTTKSDSSYSCGSIIESSGEKVISGRQRVKVSRGNNIAASNKVVDRGFVRRNTEIESVVNRNGSENVNLNRSGKRFVDRGYDSDNNVEEERAAAFSNFEDGVIAESHGANEREGMRLKRRSHGLEPESDNCSVVNNSRGKSGSRRISDNITSSNSNYSRGEKVVSSGQRDYDTQGRGSGGNKIIASNKVVDRGFVRRNAEIESAVNRNGRENVNLNRSSKRFVDRGYDSDDVEVERAAFMNFEDGGIRKQQFSHKELEERIQKLARTLNGADIDLPEWIFSKMIRSARIKFNDYSITRVIILLGQLGNWRRVIQVIEWLQRRERFKSHKLRHIYTAALDALRKSRRPVEALNIFHAMQQQMSSYPDLVAYHSIAVTLGQAGHMKELFDVVDIMRSPPKKKFKTGPFENWDPRLEPDTVVYDAVLNACVKRKQWEGAFWVLQQLKQQGQQPSATTYGLVMEVMFSCGKYNLVHEFFRKIQKSYIPNSLTYRVLVNTLWKEGKTDEAVLAVQEMESRGIVGSASLYYDLARCLCAAGRSHEALMQIDKICKVANKPLVVTYTGLMQACLDSGNIQDGAFIFEKMKEVCSPNLVTCNLLLKAYLDHGMFQEAKELFEQMSENTNHLTRRADYKMLVIPDIYTFNTMLDACVAEKRWDYFDHVYQRMLNHGFHFNVKRHLRMVLEASRAGKEGPLEITWKHLTDTGRDPPAPLMKEMFCVKLEKDEYASALKCITNNTPKDLQAFSKSSWLNLLKENSHRFQKDRLVRLMNEANNEVSNSSSPNSILVYLIQSCKEFLCANGLNVADMDSVKTVVAVESELVASSR